MNKTAVITGITGQDGSYLAELLLKKDYKVYGLKRRTSSNDLGNVKHLENDIEIIEGDLEDLTSLVHLCQTAKPNEFYNLAAQSHVGSSFKQPIYTSNVTGLGVLNCLEAIRISGYHTRFYQAATSELFGNLTNGELATEITAFHPRSPYGVSKLYGYWATVNYREAYKMFACNGILFNHECLFAETPIFTKKNNDIDIQYVSELISYRSDISHDSSYLEKDYRNDNTEIWNGFKFVKLITVSRKKINKLSTENQYKQVTNARCGVVTTTPNHKLINSEQQKKPARDFKKDSMVMFGTMPKSNETKTILTDMAYLMGLLTGGGYIGENHIQFTNNDQELRNEFSNLISDLFCDISIPEKEFISGFGGTTTQSVVTGLGKDHCSWLRKQLYERKTKHKKVPKQILNSASDIKLSFLRGYYAADESKKDKYIHEFKSFKTNSPILAQGILYLIQSVTHQLWNINSFLQNNTIYYQVNLHSPDFPNKGQHLKKINNQITKIISIHSQNQHVFDVETETGDVMAGIGTLVIGNSPRRGSSFVTRKITLGIGAIKRGEQDVIALGNLEAKRDWGFAGDYVEGMWRMLNHHEPQDFILATGETRSIREFCEIAFGIAGLGDYQKYVTVDPRFFRPAEVNVLIGDASKAHNLLNWYPQYSFHDLVSSMVQNDL